MPANIATYTHFEQLEGDPVEGVAVVELPSADVARRCHDSVAITVASGRSPEVPAAWPR
jgi:hypothetical protein